MAFPPSQKCLPQQSTIVFIPYSSWPVTLFFNPVKTWADFEAEWASFPPELGYINTPTSLSLPLFFSPLPPQPLLPLPIRLHLCLSAPTSLTHLAEDQQCGSSRISAHTYTHTRCLYTWLAFKLTVNFGPYLITFVLNLHSASSSKHTLFSKFAGNVKIVSGFFKNPPSIFFLSVNSNSLSVLSYKVLVLDLCPPQDSFVFVTQKLIVTFTRSLSKSQKFLLVPFT